MEMSSLGKAHEAMIHIIYMSQLLLLGKKKFERRGHFLDPPILGRGRPALGANLPLI